MSKPKTGVKTLAQNRKARHDYHIEEVYEAGIALTGTEIKSVRAGRIQLKDSFARIQNGELLLYNVHISPYDQGNRFNHEPERTRKLLLHRLEILKLNSLTRERGYSLVPLSIYLKGGWAKVELALVKGKKNYDKREDLKKKDAAREVERALRERQKV
ncbi:MULTISPECIES: SsrA-binding protein SmpB [Brevibacillus]|jgi:SsrA-binding protein|uniref:SsrA-binding protein n=1 Tax=Brevibacillus borstelensis AK1 TaxID=1300222 RepID=M8E3Y5_9BACL|nr:SsrA-binding protein SmpB [Brevibacillus borstelensis]EMT50170.1 SsrA-binding protein [Brevibacillus borstelensis AK1]KKX53325.1 SsrA-binding protein [Brevibacillus borstelensis cifa_chp40]MBE5393768.1 SsrA-binding protein SmpB [Brevibacillus borstelensis]MCC0566132.1 SsrA-binding protein SmpB [Brevibacillus borstelensis]MCM3472446.1 SsrA-binding protein SmpB [Brevibacillus borstelensis]